MYNENIKEKYEKIIKTITESKLENWIQIENKEVFILKNDEDVISLSLENLDDDNFIDNSDNKYPIFNKKEKKQQIDLYVNKEKINRQDFEEKTKYSYFLTIVITEKNNNKLKIIFPHKEKNNNKLKITEFENKIGKIINKNNKENSSYEKFIEENKKHIEIIKNH